MAEQTLGDREERLAENFDGTEFTECFPTNAGVSFRSKLGTVSGRDTGTGAEEVPTNGDLPVFGTAATRDIGTGGDNLSDNTGLIRSRTVAGATTVTQTDHLGVINVNVAAATVTWPSGLAIGTRVQVRKISAYDVTNNDKITIAGDGGIVFSASEQAAIDIFGDGGNWVFEQVSATRVELVSGWDVGVNDDGKWARAANGFQVVFFSGQLPTTSDGTTTFEIDYAIPFSASYGNRRQANRNITFNLTVHRNAFTADSDGSSIGTSSNPTTHAAHTSFSTSNEGGLECRVLGLNTVLGRFHDYHGEATGRWYD